VHTFTTGTSHAVPAHVSGYWPGWDIARAITLLAGSTPAQYSGYVLDGWGGLHPFASLNTPLPPSEVSTDRWPGADFARAVVMVPQSRTMGYLVDVQGNFYPFGGAPAVFVPNSGFSGPTVRSAAAA
jgi:hypothetical protein